MTRTKKKEKVRNVERNKRSKKRKKFIKKHSDLSASEQVLRDFIFSLV